MVCTSRKKDVPKIDIGRDELGDLRAVAEGEPTEQLRPCQEISYRLLTTKANFCKRLYYRWNRM
jgi:hypothetical protein